MEWFGRTGTNGCGDEGEGCLGLKTFQDSFLKRRDGLRGGKWQCDLVLTSMVPMELRGMAGLAD